MMTVTIALAVVAAVLMLPTISDALSIAIAWRRRPARRQSAVPPRLLFIVPAHDEERLIDACVRSLLALRYPSDRSTVVVVADNCSDRTAARARASGATCLERSDVNLPGKPR